MNGARGSAFIVCIFYLVFLASASEVCLLKSGASCMSSLHSFIQGGMKPGNAIRVTAELLPLVSFEVTNSAFQNIATFRFGSNSCSVENSLTSMRAYGVYKNGSFNTGSTISFDLVALEKSLAVFMAGSKILEIPLLVAGPFMISFDSSGKPPSLQFVDYSSFESAFCAIVNSGTCSNSSLVGFSSGIKKRVKVTTDLPSKVPENYFYFLISGFSDAYKLPAFEFAITKENWLLTSGGSFIGKGHIPSTLYFGSTMNLLIELGPKSSLQLTLNSAFLGTYNVDVSSIKFIYQSVSQGTMNIEM
ncbi:Gal/GalNAc binding lectin [Cryptosporidium felis]|nr:Gal/GalNAc binding lectin [Cryptosporidium felis]